MTLTLTMLRSPDAVPSKTRTVAGGEFSMGGEAENDWALPDPERSLSRRHCVLAYRSGGWQVSDLSPNGTFLNREPIGPEQACDLRDGDRLRFGCRRAAVSAILTSSSYPPPAGGPFRARSVCPAPCAGDFVRISKN